MLFAVSDTSREAYANSRNHAVDIWYAVVYAGVKNVVLTRSD